MIALRWICCVLWIAVISPESGAADDAAAFRFSRTIEVKGPPQEELFSVPLDSDVYAATRDSFPDLRVLDADDRLVPFVIRRVSESRSHKVRKSWTASSPALKPLENNGMEIRIALKPEDPSPMGLSFVTPLQNFEQQVRIYSTVDGIESTLVEGALIFDYSQFMDVRRTEVPLPPTTSREFRIVIDALTVEQQSQLLELTRSLRGDSEDSRTEKTTILRRVFRIDRIDFWTEQAETITQADAVQPWAVTDLKITHDSDKKQTLVELSSRRQPLTELKIVTGSRNFSRHAAIQVEADSGSGSQWNTVADAAISQFQLRDFQEERLTVRLPETRKEHFRIVLDNGDSPELSIDDIKAFGHQYEVIFLGKPEQSLRLVYGSETAQPPHHDTVALTTALAKDIRPVPAALGDQSMIAADTAARKAIDLKTLLNSPLAIGAVIGILVIVLGWGLFQAARRIDQMPRGDAE